jgi:hypothetical protein
MELFSPVGTNTTAVSCSTSSANGALNLPSATYGGASVRLYNSGSVTVFVQFGNSSVAATTSHMPIPAGAAESFQIGPGVTHVAGITASSTATLYATPGCGA